MTTMKSTPRTSGSATRISERIQKGLCGNTHALMQETNSRQIADLVCDWLKSHDK